MTPRAGAALFLAMAVLFLLANRAAYQGYFSADDLDNIDWTRDTGLGEFARSLVTPRFQGNNFRPVGHFFYRAMGGLFGLDYPKYVWVIHLLHFVNVWLVWWLARRLGVGIVAASLGTLFFAFHMALFDNYWKSMYVFDLLCALFSLASLLLFIQRRFVLSFVAFWLAYKSKELAVMLPAVLLLWQWWLGERRWKPLVPFFLVALSFGLQGILLNPNVGNEYTLRFTPDAVWKSLAFYSSKILLVPFAGLALALLALVFRDRRVWFGLAAMALFFVPLLVLPGRLFSAYCYLPMTGLAVSVAAIAARDWIVPVALCCLAWIPWNYHHLRVNRRHALYVAADNRAYVSALAEFARRSRATRAFVYDGAPLELQRWGIAGALRYLFGRAELYSIEDREAVAALRSDSVALLNWDTNARALRIVARQPDTPDAAYVTMDPDTPVWQLGEGWYRLENRFRWIQPYATARLRRPENARAFELRVNISPDQLRETGRTHVRVTLNGQPVGEREFTAPGWQTVRWPLTPAPAGPARVEFRVTPGFYPASGDPRHLGIPIAAFGFPP